MEESSQVPEHLPAPEHLEAAQRIIANAHRNGRINPGLLGFAIAETIAAERAAADRRVALAHARLRALRGAMLDAFDLLITGDGFHDDDRCQARDLLSDALDADDAYNQPRPAPTCVLAEEADRRVAEARITALREACGMICLRCHAGWAIVRDMDYYHGPDRCIATPIHLTIAELEARNVE